MKKHVKYSMSLNTGLSPLAEISSAQSLSEFISAWPGDGTKRCTGTELASLDCQDVLRRIRFSGTSIPYHHLREQYATLQPIFHTQTGFMPEEPYAAP